MPELHHSIHTVLTSLLLSCKNIVIGSDKHLLHNLASTSLNVHMYHTKPDMLPSMYICTTQNLTCTFTNDSLIHYITHISTSTLTHTHKHTHTHNAHSQTIHLYTISLTYPHRHSPTPINTHTHTQSHTHTQTHIHTYTYTHTHRQPQSHTPTHT